MAKEVQYAATHMFDIMWGDKSGLGLILCLAEVADGGKAQRGDDDVK